MTAGFLSDLAGRAGGFRQQLPPPVNRSASTGRFVTAATAARHPGTMIIQRV